MIQDDIADAAGWVVDKGYADKSRMCAAGWSFGGYAALMASFKHADLFKCAVDVAGPSDLETLIEDESVYYGGESEAERLIGRPFKDRARLHEDSPFRHAKEVGMPVLIVHGQADWTVAVSQSQFMSEALKGAHKDVQFLQLNLADHSLTRQATGSPISRRSTPSWPNTFRATDGTQYRMKRLIRVFSFHGRSSRLGFWRTTSKPRRAQRRRRRRRGVGDAGVARYGAR